MDGHDGEVGRRLFHLVHSLTPGGEDFLSLLAQGELPRFRQDDPATLLIAAGVSCYESSDQARALAARAPFLGEFVAELLIPDDACAIDVVRTTRAVGHYTVWASPRYFVSRVVSVEPV